MRRLLTVAIAGTVCVAPYSDHLLPPVTFDAGTMKWPHDPVDTSQGISVSAWEAEQDQAIAARNVNRVPVKELLLGKTKPPPLQAQPLPEEMPFNLTVPKRRPVEHPIPIFANDSHPFGGITFDDWKAEQAELQARRKHWSDERNNARKPIPVPQPQVPTEMPAWGVPASDYHAGSGPADYATQRKNAETRAAVATGKIWDAQKPLPWHTKPVIEHPTKEQSVEAADRQVQPVSDELVKKDGEHTQFYRGEITKKGSDSLFYGSGSGISPAAPKQGDASTEGPEGRKVEPFALDPVREESLRRQKLEADLDHEPMHVAIPAMTQH